MSSTVAVPNVLAKILEHKRGEIASAKVRRPVEQLQSELAGAPPVRGFVAALRAAIIRLWNDPGLAEAMGRRGREFIERHHTIEQFVESVRAAVEAVSGKTGSIRPFELEHPAIRETA